jgi:predicted Fe-Mo cluster-binding NifX family protein
MKIAVPLTNDNNVDGHFGHCDSFGVYTISETNEITDVKSVSSPEGCGCKSDIASILASDGVKVMLAGGIGGGAVNVLNNSGIEVIRGCSGPADELVKLYVSGAVKDNGSSCHQHEGHHDHDHHHHHHDGHNCSHN